MEISYKDSAIMKKSTLGRIKRRCDIVNNKDSTLNKAVKASKKGIQALQKLGSTYNKFAQWLALPQAPDVFLGGKIKWRTTCVAQN